jgi:methyl-accepting chemotaxis protein
MGDLADAIEGSELNSVVAIFGNDDSSSEESSKLDLDDFVDEIDSASQKRLTLNVVNDKFSRKITNMSGKMQRRNDKYKKEKKKADVNNESESVNESINQIKESVNESVNETIHAEFQFFGHQVDEKFERVNQKQTELSNNLQRLESNMVDLRKALINDDTRLSELNTRVVNISEQQVLLQKQQKKDGERIVYLSEESKKQHDFNEHFQNEIKRVDSFSNFLKLRCDDVHDSVKQISQSMNERTDRLETECAEIKKRACNHERQNQEMNSHINNLNRSAERNQCEINKHSRQIGEVDVRIEQLTEQIRDIRVVDEITQVVPAAENWQARGRKRSESDMEQHIGSFHGHMKRHKSTARSGLSTWDVDVSDGESQGSLDHVRNGRCEGDRSSGDVNRPPRVNFERQCLSNEPLSSTHSLNDVENANSKNSPDELNLVARLITQLTQCRNAITLPPFDGINADLNSYKRQCMAIAKQNGWNSQELAVQIISSLQGDARTLMSLLPNGEENNLDSVWKILNSRFDRTVSVEMAKNQLNTLQQKKGESFLHLQLEVERLINRAYPLANDEMRSQLALDQFVKSINSSGVRYEVRLKSPKDLSQARHMAEEISIIQNSEKYQRLTYVNQITLTDVAKASGTEDDEEAEEKRKRRRRKKATHFDSREPEQVMRRDNFDQPQQYNSPGRRWYRGDALPQRGEQRQDGQYQSRGSPRYRGNYSSSRGAMGNGSSEFRYNQREFNDDQNGGYSRFQQDQRGFDGDREDRGGYCNDRSGNWNGNPTQRGRENFNRGRGSQDQRWAHRQRLRDLMEADQPRSPVKGVRRQ